MRGRITILIRLGRLFCLAFVLSCSNPDTSNTLPRDVAITLERTACFGPCPTYKVTIENRTVVFEGYENVRVKGEAKDQISVETLRALVSEFDKISYFSLRDTYLGPEDGCPGEATDMPSANTSFRVNGRRKSVSHYLGCSGSELVFTVYPPELANLEDRIDELVGTEKWIGAPGDRPLPRD